MTVPELLPAFGQDSGAQAAHRLFSACAARNDASILPVAEFLVSLYDSRLARPDIYMLCRRINGEHFEDVLTVMKWFRGVEDGFDIHHLLGVEAGVLLVQEVTAKLLIERYGEY